MSVILKAQGPSTSAFFSAIELDASIKEEVSYTAEVTEHPVEQGSNIADNVRVKLLVLTIEGIISDNPLNQFNQTTPSVSSAPGGSGLANPQKASRASQVVLQGLAWWLSHAQQLQVQTPVSTYDSFVLQSLKVPHDAQSGDALHVSMTLKQVITVTAQIVTVTVPGAEQDLGTKTAPEASADAKAAAASNLDAGSDVGVNATTGPLKARDLMREGVA